MRLGAFCDSGLLLGANDGLQHGVYLPRLLDSTGGEGADRARALITSPSGTAQHAAPQNPKTPRLPRLLDNTGGEGADRARALITSPSGTVQHAAPQNPKTPRLPRLLDNTGGEGADRARALITSPSGSAQHAGYEAHLNRTEFTDLVRPKP